MASPPSATPKPKGRSGPGCLTIAVLLPVVVIAGLVVGGLLNRQEDPTGERSVTLDEGSLAGTAWRVEAQRDIQGDTCAFLYADDKQLSGACTLTPQDATFGTRTVVFGRAASTATTVSVVLSDDRSVDIPTRVAKGISGRFYVQVVDGNVDAAGFAP